MANSILILQTRLEKKHSQNTGDQTTRATFSGINTASVVPDPHPPPLHCHLHSRPLTLC